MVAAGLGARASRTRSAVLDAAEDLFAAQGLDGTRLEDIAERVGIRRASIVYYFKDKRELYDAVLASVFGDLHAALAASMTRDVPLRERIEAAVSSWVDFVGRRPSVARIILREVANAGPGRRSGVLEYTQPFADLVRKEIFARPDFAEAQLAHVDPVHVASTVAGATVFLVAAMPALLPDRDLDPTSSERLEIHKRELVGIVRHLLDTPESRRE
jgi:TetR/AcrR family transcriptional regulator